MDNQPKYIVVHCTAVSYKRIPDQFESVNLYHREQGFDKSSLGIYVGYHRLITGGKNYKCREDWEHGCHTNQQVDGLSMNKQSLGICIGFNGDVEYPSQDDLKVFINQIHQWQMMHSISNDAVVFHNRFNKTKTCPGSLITSEWLSNTLWPTSSKPDDHHIVEEGGIPEKEIVIADLDWRDKIIRLIKALLNKR